MSLRAAGAPITQSSSGDGVPGTLLPHVAATQFGHSLCWAACVESVFASAPHNKRISQSFLARKYIGGCDTTYRLHDIRDTDCDKALNVDAIANVWRDLGFPNIEFLKAPQDPSTIIKQQLFNGSPVQVWIDRFHAVMVYGYKITQAGREKVFIMDPQPGVGDGWHSIDASASWSGLWIGLHA